MYVINEQTKVVNIWADTDINRQRLASGKYGVVKYRGEIEQGYDGTTYAKGYAPVKPASTYEEVEQQRLAYRQLRIDKFTLARMRKQANGTWTEEDEAAYLALDAQVTAYIEENFPYPEETLTEPSSSNIIETSETDINSILGE